MLKIPAFYAGSIIIPLFPYYNQDTLWLHINTQSLIPLWYSILLLHVIKKKKSEWGMILQKTAHYVDRISMYMLVLGAHDL